MAPRLKLTYFDARGRGEPPRLALHIGGIDFEDDRLTVQDFGAIKPGLPYGQVPVLEVDGEVYAQGVALLKYAGKLAGIYPVDPLAAARVDEWLYTVEDGGAKIADVYNTGDEEKRGQKMDALLGEALPAWLGMVDRRLQAKGGMYAVGQELTVADLYLYCLWANLSTGVLTGIPPSILDACPTFCRMAEKVGAHPKVEKWNEKH